MLYFTDKGKSFKLVNKKIIKWVNTEETQQRTQQTLSKTYKTKMKETKKKVCLWKTKIRG